MSITDSNSVAIDDSIVLEYYPVPRDERQSSIGRGPIVLGVATSVRHEDAISNQTIIQKKKITSIETLIDTSTTATH